MPTRNTNVLTVDARSAQAQKSPHLEGYNKGFCFSSKYQGISVRQSLHSFKFSVDSSIKCVLPQFGHSLVVCFDI
jgi:hypothetical protein